MEATKVPGITTHLDDCRPKNPDANREVANKPKKDATDKAKGQGSKNRPREPDKTPRLNDLSKKFVERVRAGTIYDPSMQERVGGKRASEARCQEKKLRKSTEIVEVDVAMGSTSAILALQKRSLHKRRRRRKMLAKMLAKQAPQKRPWTSMHGRSVPWSWRR